MSGCVPRKGEEIGFNAHCVHEVGVRCDLEPWQTRWPSLDLGLLVADSGCIGPLGRPVCVWKAGKGAYHHTQ